MSSARVRSSSPVRSKASWTGPGRLLGWPPNRRPAAKAITTQNAATKGVEELGLIGRRRRRGGARGKGSQRRKSALNGWPEDVCHGVRWCREGRGAGGGVQARAAADDVRGDRRAAGDGD